MTRIFGLLFAVVALTAPANAALLVSYDFTTDAKAKVFTAGLTARDFNQFGMTAGTTGAGANGSGIYGGNPSGASYTPSIGGRFRAVTNVATVNTSSFNQETATSLLVRVDNTTGYRVNLSSFSYTLYNSTTSSTGVWASRTIFERTSIRKSGESVYSQLTPAGTSPPSNYSIPVASALGPAGSSTTLPTSQDVNRSFLPSGSLVLNPGEFVEVRVYLLRNSTTDLSRTFEIDNFQIHGDVIPEPASIAIFGGIAAIGVVRRIRRKN